MDTKCKHPSNEVFSRWVSKSGRKPIFFRGLKVHKEYTCLSCGKTWVKNPNKS